MEESAPYVIVESIILEEVEQKVNHLIANGYSPQPMVIAPAMPGAISRPRYIVPMVRTKEWACD